MMASGDGFTLVNRQKKSKWKRSENQSSSSLNYSPIDMDNETIPGDYQEFIGKFKSKLQKSVEFLKKSRFIDQVANYLLRRDADKEVNLPLIKEKEDPIDCLAANLTNCSLNQFGQIVSYGIGQFSSSRDALYQFALLWILKADCILNSDSWLIYDPVFTNYERQFLNENGFKLIAINEKGAKSIDMKTLFFMPHCPLPMFNNLLWANWSPTKLEKLVLLGTSLNCLVDSFISSDQQSEYSYLIAVTNSKLVKEYHLDPPRDVYQSFNDLSVHFFTLINDNAADCLLSGANCDPKKKPIYSDDVFSKEMIVNHIESSS